MRAAWETTYYYDLIDRLGKYREIGPDFEHSVTYTYDERNNLSKLDETINGATQTTRYSYDYENRLIATTYNYLAKGKNVIEGITYDNYGRMQSVDIGEAEIGEAKTVVFDTWFAYQDGKSTNSATSKLRTMAHLSSLYHALGIVYEYDGQGNITKYTASVGHEFDYDPYFDTLTRQGDSYYHYDTANQLVREDNAWLGKTLVWTYDNAGNITSRKEYAYTDRNSAVSGTPTATYAYTYGDSTWRIPHTAFTQYILENAKIKQL